MMHEEHAAFLQTEHVKTEDSGVFFMHHVVRPGWCILGRRVSISVLKYEGKKRDVVYLDCWLCANISVVEQFVLSIYIPVLRIIHKLCLKQPPPPGPAPCFVFCCPTQLKQGLCADAETNICSRRLLTEP